MHREQEVPEAEAQVGKWLDCRARITSKDLAPIHSVKNGILQNALMRIARLKNSLAKRSKKNGDKSAVAMLKRIEHHHETVRPVVNAYSSKYTTIGLRISRYGAAEVFIDFTEELKQTETNPMCSIHKSRRTSC